MSGRVNPLGAESRAVEEGARAILEEDGAFRVRSSTRDLWWRVTFGAVPAGTEYMIHFSCACESGTARPGEPVPCKHSAAVGRRLERMHWAKWSGGFWYATDLALAAAGLLPAQAEPKHIKGRCPVCSRFLTIEYPENELREPKAVAAAHDPKCRTEFARRQVRVAGQLQSYERTHGKRLDPWEDR